MYLDSEITVYPQFKIQVSNLVIEIDEGLGRGSNGRWADANTICISCSCSLISW